MAELGQMSPKNVSEARLREGIDRVPQLMRADLEVLLDQCDQFKQNIKMMDKKLAAYSKTNPQCRRLTAIQSIGVTTATALVARVTDIHAFRQGRSFSNYLGITAREHSSGNKRRLGGITKQGDTYLRTLLVHCGRSGILAAKRKAAAGGQLTQLERWAVHTEQQLGHNKAAVAMANKLARIVWAVWTKEDEFNGNDALRFAA